VSIAVLAWADDQVHVLERGQTIYTLTRIYGVSAEDIQAYNNIDDPTKLPVGARILIPGTYTVKPGEYIYSIARDLGVDPDKLLEMNDLDRDDVVRPGDVLLVPRSAIPDTGQAATVAQNADQTNPINTDDTAMSSGSEIISTDPGDTVEWPLPGDRHRWDGRFPGVVMDGAPGDEFRSVASGVVSFVGPFTSFGILTLVRSENGYLYGYAGADHVNVVLGQRVGNGTVLGTVGISPAFQSARVLFAVWRNNRYIDPALAPRG